jgi:hypothetical protein
LTLLTIFVPFFKAVTQVDSTVTPPPTATSDVTTEVDKTNNKSDVTKLEEEGLEIIGAGADEEIVPTVADPSDNRVAI